MSEHLLLKWGTLKGWNLESERAKDLLQKYAELGVTLDVMQQNDSPEQKQILCDLIDAVDGEIENDWSGEKMTKEDAKKYVLEYGKSKP